MFKLAPRTPADFGGAPRSPDEDDLFFEQMHFAMHGVPRAALNAPERHLADRINFTGAETPESLKCWGQPLR